MFLGGHKVATVCLASQPKPPPVVFSWEAALAVEPVGSRRLAHRVDMAGIYLLDCSLENLPEQFSSPTS